MPEIICPQCKAANRGTAQFCAECGTPLLSSLEHRSTDDTLISSKSALNAPPTPQRVLQNRYRVEEPLGRGGFGSVYRAWDLNLERACAIKENLVTSADSQRQFMREATVLSNLSHPNLPRVIDHFIIPDQGQYLVMDYVEGEDLESVLERRELVTLEEAADWILQVSDALDYLHRQKPPVFHRDIKPANIRLTPGGQAMLVDFGLVKVFDPYLNTTQGARAITPGYAPPEQYGRGGTDARSDLYALGATFYALITGHEPVESVSRLAGKTLLTAQQANPNVPRQVSEVIERLMAIEPSNRYSSASEFRKALREALSAGTQPDKDQTLISGRVPAVAAAPVTSPQVAGTIAVEPVDPTRNLDFEAVSDVGVGAFPPAEQPAKRKKPWLIAGVGLVGLLICLGLGGGLAIILFGGGDQLSPVDKTLTAHARMEAPIQATLTARAGERIAATPQAEVSATADKDATRQAEFAASATAELATLENQTESAATTSPTETSISTAEGATEQARTEYLAGLQEKAKLVYGPKSGRILHKAESGEIQMISASIGVRNFISEVVFTSPYSPSEGDWDFGLLFRDSGSFVQFRLIFFSDQTWYLASYTGSPEEKALGEGKVENLQVDAGAQNKIRLYAIEDRGWIYLNDELLTEFDASQHYSGGVAIGIGFFEGNGVTGKLTEYKDFTVWTLPTNP